MKLNLIRNEIDKIDSAIIKLIMERMRYSKEAGKIKKVKGLPIEDTKRENDIIKKVRNIGGEYGDIIEKILMILIDESKNIQYDIINNK